MGEVLARSGDIVRGLSLYNQALTLSQQCKDNLTHILVCNKIGELYRLMDDYTKSREYCETALRKSKKIGYPRGEAHAFLVLGDLERRLSRHHESHIAFEKALSIFERIEDGRGKAASLRGHGDLAYFSNDYDASRSYYEKAFILSREIGDRHTEARSLYGLARLDLAVGHRGQARVNCDQACMMFKEMNDVWGEIDALCLSGNIEGDSNNHNGAKDLYRQSWLLCEKIGQKKEASLSFTKLSSFLFL